MKAYFRSTSTSRFEQNAGVGNREYACWCKTHHLILGSLDMPGHRAIRRSEIPTVACAGWRKTHHRMGLELAVAERQLHLPDGWMKLTFSTRYKRDSPASIRGRLSRSPTWRSIPRSLGRPLHPVSSPRLVKLADDVSH